MELTLSQKDIYNEQLLFPDLPIYNIGGKIEIKGFICEKTLYKACCQFIEDHDSYRMIVKEESEEPQIEFLEKYDFTIDYKDFSEQADARGNVEEYLRNEFLIPFSFSNQKLLNRFILVKISEDFHCLFTYYHHIITDGWGSSLMIQRIIQNYNEMVAYGKTISTYDFKYEDYILEDIEYQKSKTFEDDKNYWINKFIDDIPDQIFRKKIGSSGLLKSEREELIIDRSFYNELLKFCEDENTTFFHFILASLFSYMGISCSLDAMAIGIPTLNRSSRKYKKTVGLFAGISPLKINLKSSETFTDLLKTISRELRNDYRHQRFPFGKLMNEFNLSDPNELFNIVLSYEKHDYAHHFVDTITEVIPFNHGLERVAMAIYIREWYDNDDVRIHFDYNQNYLDQDEVSNFIENFFYFIKSVLIDIEKPLNELSYLTPANQDKLLYGFNQTKAAYPQDKTVIDLFESQVLLTPENIALIFEGTELSYRELNDRSNQFAHYLRSEYNIGREDLVGVQLERSSDFVITILGILKSGGAYVPIDPSYPSDRIAYMKEDSGCKVVVDIEELLLFKMEMDDYSVLPVEHRSQPDDLVYVIYTSGSTGRPKGVMVEHGGALNMALSQIREFGLVSSDIVFFFASIAFDASFSELMMSLLSGSSLFICEDDVLKDKNKFVEILKSSGTSVITLPPAYSEILSLDDLSGLRVLISAGESSSIEKGLSLCGSLSYFNAYGPTECSVCSSIYRLSEKDSWRKSIPIGSPISNTRMYILSAGGSLCPLGVVGEICISGAGLARGYLNNELLTKEKFVSNQYVPGDRLYKTGDLGRWLSDGSIEYIGRKDNQVKIRGYRIELGEIELALQGHADVSGSVVLAVENNDGQKELAAYITGTRALSGSELRDYLRGTLPDYMVPGHYIQLESFPLTSNGKLDRKGLPDAFLSSLGSGIEYVSARNETEEKLVSIWENVLGKSGIGIKDNFFELGGHSLKTARLSTLIHQTFHIKISVQEIFNESTIEKQRMLLDNRSYQEYYSIPTSPILDSYPLSSSQRRLLLLSNFSGASGAYNIPAVLRFSGSLDINFLKESYFSMLSRHEILRTVFRETIDGMGCQIVLPDAHSDSFTHLFLDFVSEKGVIEEIIFQETGRIFELSSGPLIRLTLVEDRSGGGYIFCLVMHHIISDGWSMDILQRELFTLYNNFKSGSSAVLPPLGLQYKDYAFWEQSNNEHLDSTSRDYWRAQFSGELPVLALPSKGARPAVKTYNSSHVSGFVSLDTLSLLKEVSLTSGSTLFMTVLSAVKVLLYRYSGQKDLIIGTPVAGREHADLEDQIGFYVNTLALRSCIDGEDRFMDFLSSVRETTLQGYSHQSYPFDRLVEDLDIVRDLSRHPVFDVMVSFQESVSGVSESNSVFSDGLIVEPYNTSGYAVSKFDLDFSFSENASGLSIGLGYNTDIYDLSFVERLLNSLEILLVSISCTPEMNINKLDILGAEDHYLLTQGFNQTAAVYPKDKSVIDLFESQVLLTPENTALIFEGTEFSYGELNERSNQFAHYLRSQYNIGREDLVGVELERSDSLIIALLGILKSGGAYVPIDPSYPSERIAYMLSDSGCKVNINAEEYLLFNMERDLYSCESIGEYPSSCDLAYVIYTSGSTGQPKGVMVEHGSLANLLLDVSSLFPFGGSLSGSFPLLASPAFDISLFELFYPLLQGLGVMVLGQDKIKDVDYLRAHLGEMNSLHTVPALMSELLSQIKSSGSAENYSHIEYIFIGGDKVPTPVLHDIRSVFRDAKIVTLYGPTECTIFLLTRSYTNSVDEFNGSLLGCPISNTQVYILSEGESLCPVGVVGEICISGAGLARGYLNKESLTNEKFVINPYSGENMYKTGDLGRWDSEGNIEFLGRKDNQVKIRGYRIELGEIESTLQGHEGVTGSVVLAVENEEGQKELAAYITGTGALSGSELRDYLRGSLPDYMIPGHYLQLDSFPLTSNGKLDRSNLPDVFGVSLGSGVEYVAARNETEEKLISIWENVLGKSGIGIKDNFFELGGHSLKAARLSALIHKEFNVKISLQDIFTELSNIELISQYLTKEQSKKKWLELNLSNSGEDDVVDEVFL